MKFNFVSLFLLCTISFFPNKYIVHTVKKKETLWRISKTYNVSINEICRINHITDITKIRCGTKIKLPNKQKKLEYFDYKLPLDGEIRDFITSHFRGLVIFVKKSTSQKSAYEDKVVAVDKGVVSFVKEVGGYGLTVFIKLENGYLSTYSGFKKIFVKEGDSVKSGQILGQAGILSRYNRKGIIFSIQKRDAGLKYEKAVGKFIKN